MNPIDILNSKKILLEIEHQGCFGGSSQVLTIEEKNGERYLTNEYTKGVRSPNTILPFNSEKEQVLFNLISAGIANSDSIWCVGQSFYHIETESYQCDFEGTACGLDSLLNKLFKK